MYHPELSAATRVHAGVLAGVGLGDAVLAEAAWRLGPGREVIEVPAS
ncbi:hypothetical protein [Streptomyces carpinensis]|uniref:Uncharacterized protein n=1 Tax=Streptomyces carpinensis TaxID=66369 RepID=A0ABV1WJ07_9ACTN|nr:hypothetical protein [Streptomyces carpinensis]